MAAFAELGCSQELVRAVEELGWLLPTPVQQEAVPLILGGGDVMASAETGSGKTGAFALPVLQITHEALRQQQMQRTGTGGGAAAAAAAAAAASTASASAGVSDDRDGLLAVGGGGLQLTCGAANAWAGCRGSLGVTGGGRYHYEAKQLSAGILRAGWSSPSARLALGTDKQGFGFGGTGKKSHGGSFDAFGEPYGEGDVLGVTLDYGDASISYQKNGVDLGVAFTVPPHLLRQPLFPALCLKGCSVALNVAGPFLRLPAGAVALAAAPAEHTSRGSGGSGGGDGGGDAEAAPRCPTAVLLEPARDLAEQVHDEVTKFGRYFREPPLRAALFVGGVDAGAQLRALKGGVDIVSGTPGRLLDLVQGGKLKLHEVQLFVLDEADRLLDTGNLETILKLHAKLPPRGRTGGRLQTLLFSATLHTDEVRQLAARITRHPILVDLKGKDSVPETVHHLKLSVDAAADASWAKPPLPVPTDGVHRSDAVAPGSRTRESLSEATKRLKPLVLLRLAEQLQMAQCLVFCRTNLDCDNLERYLNAVGGGKGFSGKAEKGKENPYSCVVLAGQRSMEQRRSALRAFKEGDVRFMVCTDVAARGLDIAHLPFVVNMTLPDKVEDYFHRVGRVGRAETMGLAVSLVSPHEEKVWYYDKRKWEGKTLSTKLAEHGGCCIWYSEPALLAEVEKRLGGPIETIDAFLSSGGDVAQRLAQYGEAKDGGLNQQSHEQLESIAPAVEQLAALETRAQHSFLLGLRASLSRGGGGGGAGGAGGIDSAGGPDETSKATVGRAGGKGGGGKGKGKGGGKRRGGRGSSDGGSAAGVTGGKG